MKSAIFTPFLVAVALFTISSQAQGVKAEEAPGDAVIKAINDTKLNPSGMLQIWFRSTDSDGQLQSPAQSDERSNGVLLRRAEFAVGEVRDKKLEWRVMVDLTKGPHDKNGNPSGDPKVLQDMFVGWTFDKALKIRVGQFHVPTNLEGLHPSGDLMFAERSWLGWRLGDRRDVGVAASGEVEAFRYQVGVFNGQGNNAEPGGNIREVAGRVSYLFADKFDFGLWFASRGKQEAEDKQQSGGASAKWLLGKTTLQAEYSSRWEGGAQHGYYLGGTYQLTKASQLAARVEQYKGFFEPKSDELAGEVGYNRILDSKGQLRFQADFRTGTIKVNGDRQSFNLGIAAIQVGF